jgi:hypothetical protein
VSDVGYIEQSSVSSKHNEQVGAGRNFFLGAGCSFADQFGYALIHIKVAIPCP